MRAYDRHCCRRWPAAVAAAAALFGGLAQQQRALTAPILLPPLCPHPAVLSKQICLGPVCVPLHLLLPFLLGLAHQYGYLRWLRREWLTWAYWRPRVRAFFGLPPAAAAAAAPPQRPAAAASAGGGGGDGGAQWECDGVSHAISSAGGGARGGGRGGGGGGLLSTTGDGEPHVFRLGPSHNPTSSLLLPPSLPAR